MNAPRFPGRAPIDAYGNGGFRFAGMSHKGSLLCLPEAIVGWPVRRIEEVSADSLAAVLGDGAHIGFLLLGTGDRQAFPAPEVRRAFREAHMGLDVMDTGAACRTYNVLLAEGRPVAAALIAVD